MNENAVWSCATSEFGFCYFRCDFNDDLLIGETGVKATELDQLEFSHSNELNCVNLCNYDR